MLKRTSRSLLFAVTYASSWSAQAADLPAWIPERRAPRLPSPKSDVIRVTSVAALFQAAKDVRPGGTIAVADGHYMMPRYFEIQTDNVTLRGESGERANVILDGARSRHGELLGISNCSGVTIADLTVQNVMWNGIKLNSNRNVQRVTIWNCVIRNVWQRGVKGVKVPEANREANRPRDCRIQHCLFVNDRAKRFADDTADTTERFNGNYIGGIDVMYATDWVISDNVFVGIRGRTGEARGAIFLWHDARGCVIERNIIVDCDTGICLGNSFRAPGTAVHCTDCIVRNNFVTRTPETGILADYTRDCAIVHNTIHDPGSRLKRLIRLVHNNDGLLVANNLLSGPPLRRDLLEGTITEQDNVTRLLTEAFVDASTGDLHLRGPVNGVTRAVPCLQHTPHDIDGQARESRTAAGADDRPPRSTDRP